MAAGPDDPLAFLILLTSKTLKPFDASVVPGEFIGACPEAPASGPNLAMKPLEQ